MNRLNRLKTLEAKYKERALKAANCRDPLMEELIKIADRLRGIPLSKITRSPSVIEILALVFDGRVDEAVYEKCVEYSDRDGQVGRLFAVLLEKANAA